MAALACAGGVVAQEPAVRGASVLSVTWLACTADAGRLGVSTYLVPPLVVLLGWMFLAETPPLLALPGGFLCLAGVGLTRRR